MEHTVLNEIIFLLLLQINYKRQKYFQCFCDYSTQCRYFIFYLVIESMTPLFLSLFIIISTPNNLRIS